MKTKLSNYIRAGYPGVYVVSVEEQRVEKEVAAAIEAVNAAPSSGKNRKSKEEPKPFKLYSWSLTQGVVSVESDSEKIEAFKDTQQPFLMLKQFDALPERSVLLLRDFHMILAERNASMYRKIKDSLLLAKGSNRVLVIMGCTLNLPPELEKEIVVVETALPDREQLRAIMHSIAQAGNVKLNKDIEDSFIDAACGLTTTEAENAFALSIVETGEIVKSVVYREKSNIIRKNGLLEIVETDVTLNEVGGLEMLKQDLLEKRNLFTKGAADYGLPSPRGVLVVGQPGTGKSLIASVGKSVFGIPLFRLEASKLFGSLVGQSEGNWRTAFATVKAVAPCILWIDEVDGLFCGAQSSGQTDSGVTSRVIKAILQDMQFNSKDIFYFFTANDIDGLPDPLIDRLDVWSVDLPNQSEREAIISIHIAKRNRKPEKFDISTLAKKLDGFSGRQIEQVWLKAMTFGFNDKLREPTTKDLELAATRFVPTSTTMAEQIGKRRERLKGRAAPASRQEAVAKAGSRKLAT